MAVPARGALTDGHCLLIPVRHSISCVGLDEDVWDELQMFMKCLVQMWAAEDKVPSFCF